jgi:uncharacterized protein with HEPN domain
MSDSLPTREWHFYVNDMIAFANNVISYTAGLESGDMHDSQARDSRFHCS